jgi:hypothetical protein
MPNIQKWCDEAAVVHWEQENSNPPTWEEVYRRMIADGHFTRLTKPSPAHLERKIPQPSSCEIKGLLLRPRKKATPRLLENQT